MRKLRKQKIPKLEVVAFSFTNRCNLACRHCGYDHLNRDERCELPVEFFIRCLEEARQLGAHSANITGGEVFLRQDCLKLVAAGVELGYFMSIESNGTLISDANVKQLQSLGKKIRIAISLDGVTRPVHEAVRGPNTFSRTMAALMKLSKAKVPTRINTVLQTDNILEVPRIAAFAIDELGIGFRLLPFILEYGKGACACKTNGVPYGQIKEFTEGFLYPFMRNHAKSDITVGLKMALVPIDISGHLICPWGQSLIGIGPSGVASLCHVTNNIPRFTFGDLSKESLTDIWTANERLLEFRNMSPDSLKGVCGNCQAREVCRGGCRLNAFASYGDFLAPDSQCQMVYNMGMFPEYALEHQGQDCRYEHIRQNTETRSLL